MILVQMVEIKWGKEYRGAPKAAIRNSVSEAYEFLPFLSREKKYGYQSFSCYAWSDFIKSHIETKEQDETPQQETHIGFFLQENELKTYYLPNCDQGEKFAWEKRKFAFKLKENEWGQIKFNGRYEVDEEWIYTKNIYNIGRFTNPPSNVFISSKADYLYEDMKNIL
ncbi:hypothetical protein [Candidatus Uabimicrobium sp. HlEnr_7]|uniref:hypothetical protein n=1 Tax=Candidatus Uabimicrobium helgolandensis TaxID=3095367 RepID=UPI0035572045